jgi:hypothetical protein
MSKNYFGLRTPKRNARLSPRPDPEKRYLADDDWEDADSNYSPVSSRAASYNYNHEPVLAPPKSPGKQSWMRVSRRKFNRYFGITLGSAILAFVILLVWAGIASRNALSNYPLASRRRAAYESFPFLKRYHGGVRSIVPRRDNTPEYPGNREETLEMLRNISSQNAERSLPQSRPFDPFPEQEEPLEECYIGASTRIPKLHVFDGVVSGFPDPVMGSYDLLGLDSGVCFDRYGKLGPYGFGYSQNFGGNGAGMEGDREGSEAVWKHVQEVDYRKVRWADAQARCAEKNKHRFGQEERLVLTAENTKRDENAFLIATAPAKPARNAAIESKETYSPGPVPRHVVIIRTWVGYEFDAEDILYLRSLVAELGLASGGEYTVHFLVHVKDHTLPIWVDDELYRQVLDDALPAEFKGMGTLWSEAQMTMLYGGLSESNYRNLPVYGVYRSTYLPVQYFAHTHPEYEFFWHWEMDIRYTGHYYHLFDRVGNWAKKQPRKGLWERNGRFYVPAEHGTYEDFRHMVRIQTEQASKAQSSKNFDSAGGRFTRGNQPEKPVWGPYPSNVEYNVINLTASPEPPTTYEKDDYQWGVGEDADFITFNPLFDPESTGWILDKDVTGYDTSHGYPPRRTAIITASRLSRRLLETMHAETSVNKHIMFSEMWPGSCALHHGLKAVYAPHPVYIDRRWPTDYLAAVFNGGKNGASGGSKLSTFEDHAQRNFLGTTWYYHAQFSERLWKRWLGFNVDNDGGPEAELAGEGRMCLPAMLLHPIKQVDLVSEQKEDSGEPTMDDMEVGNAGD